MNREQIISRIFEQINDLCGDDNELYRSVAEGLISELQDELDADEEDED